MTPHCKSAPEKSGVWHALALPCALGEAHFALSPHGAGAAA